MTMVYYAIAGVIAGLTSWMGLRMLEIGDIVGAVASLLVGVLVMLLWDYSPLPNHNGGMLAGTEHDEWGW